MDFSSSEGLFTKKNIISFLVLAIIILSIPLGVNLAKRQTEIRIQAAGGDIGFPDTETQACKGSHCTTTSDLIKVEIKAPADF